MNRRTILQTAIGACVGLLCPSLKKARVATPRQLSQWQWQAGEIGFEVEGVMKRLLARCDIGNHRGTFLPVPQRHNMFCVWVDMDDETIAKALSERGEIPDEFPCRCYAVRVPIIVILMYPEDELAESLQKALLTASKYPQARRWKYRWLPDNYKGVVDLVDHLPTEENTG